MSTKESFTTSTDAITHDSDPKLLNFQQMSQDPADEQWDGRILDNLGPTLDMSLLNMVGPTPGTPATVNDMTGGDENIVTLTLLPPDFVPHVTSDMLTAGNWGCLFTLDDSSTVPGPAFYDYTTMQLDDVSVWGHPTSKWRVPLISEGPIVIPAGRTVVSVTFAVDTPFAAAGASQYNDTFIGFSYVGNASDAYFGDFAASLGGQTVPVIGDVASTSDRAITYRGMITDSGTVPTTVSVPIDAASVKLACSAPQLASSMIGYNVATPATPFPPASDSPLLLGIDVLNIYAGWTVIGVTFPNASPYDGLPAGSFIVIGLTVQSELLIMNDIVEFYPLDGLTLTYNPAQLSLPYSLPMTNQAVTFRIMIPDSPPVPGQPLIVTEPYEIRHRNLWAAHFRVLGTRTPSTATEFHVIVFGSQGPVFTRVFGEPNGIFDWTAITGQAFGRDGTRIGYDINIPIKYSTTDLPNMWLDNTILPATNGGGNSIGPWNYIRFVIYPSLDSETGQPQDYSGLELQILANAREVL